MAPFFMPYPCPLTLVAALWTNYKLLLLLGFTLSEGVIAGEKSSSFCDKIHCSRKILFGGDVRAAIYLVVSVCIRREQCAN